MRGMNMQRRVKVFKRRYTPRNEIEKGRFNIILYLKAKVPENSYLATLSMPASVDPYIKVYKKFINVSEDFLEHKNILKYINDVNRIVRESLKDNGITGKFPRYGDKYFIPGSAIKGAVRSRVEYKFIPYNFQSYSCYIVQNPFINMNFAKNHVKFWGNDVTLHREECYGENVCIVCDLFGSRGLESRVQFSDAVMEKGGVEKLGDLNIEAVKPNSEFSLKIYCKNVNFVDLGILMLGLEIFTNSPILLGMYKYRFRKNKYRGRYFFGLLNMGIVGFKEVLTNELSNFELKDIIKRSFVELKDSFGEYLDINKGVIRY